MIVIPKLNPISFRKIDPQRLAQYISKPYEDYRYMDTRQPFEERSPYCQPWQRTDAPVLQIFTDQLDVKFRVIDRYGVLKLEYSAADNVKRSLKNDNRLKICEIPLSYSLLNPGFYQVIINISDEDYAISEPQHIADYHVGTVLLEYSHPRYHLQSVFETGWFPQFRVEGRNGRLIPGSTDFRFTDPTERQILLSSTPFVSWPFIVGPSNGVPDWVVEKVRYIVSCGRFYIDGIEYAKEEGDFEFSGQEGLPRRGFSFNVREGSNLQSLVFDPAMGATGTSVVYNVRTNAFSNLPTDSGNSVQIVELESE